MPVGIHYIVLIDSPRTSFYHPIHSHSLMTISEIDPSSKTRKTSHRIDPIWSCFRTFLLSCVLNCCRLAWSCFFRLVTCTRYCLMRILATNFSESQSIPNYIIRLVQVQVQVLVVFRIWLKFIPPKVLIGL